MLKFNKKKGFNFLIKVKPLFLALLEINIYCYYFNFSIALVTSVSGSLQEPSTQI